MIYKAKVNNSHISIVQAYDLTERLEKFKIKGYGAAIASVDFVNMYPSIKLATIRKTVIFSQENLPQKPKRPTFAWR